MAATNGSGRLYSIGILRYPTSVKINYNLKITIKCRLTYVIVSTRKIQTSSLVQPPAYFPRPVTPPTPLRIVAYPVILCDGTQRNAISTFALTVTH
jgi:hypothetical protein